MMATKVLPAIVRKLSGATTVLAEPASSMGIGPVALTDVELELVAGGGSGGGTDPEGTVAKLGVRL
jgi:hypothetical protein